MVELVRCADCGFRFNAPTSGGRSAAPKPPALCPSCGAPFVDHQEGTQRDATPTEVGMVLWRSAGGLLTGLAGVAVGLGGIGAAVEGPPDDYFVGGWGPWILLSALIFRAAAIGWGALRLAGLRRGTAHRARLRLVFGTLAGLALAAPVAAAFDRSIRMGAGDPFSYGLIALVGLCIVIACILRWRLVGAQGGNAAGQTGISLQ